MNPIRRAAMHICTVLLIGIAISACTAADFGQFADGLSHALENASEASQAANSTSNVVLRGAGSLDYSTPPSEYTLNANPDEEYIIVTYVSGNVGGWSLSNVTGNAVLWRGHEGGHRYAFALSSHGPWTRQGYTRHSSGVLPIREAGPHALQIQSSTRVSPDRYSFQVLRRDRSPHHGNERIRFDTEIRGTLQHESDIDEYRFTGAAGQRVSITLQGLNGVRNNHYGAEIVGPNGTLGDVRSAGNAPTFDTNVSGVIELPANAEYIVRILAPRQSFGDYRFRVNTH
jgi:hypothetical protein